MFCQRTASWFSHCQLLVHETQDPFRASCTALAISSLSLRFARSSERSAKESPSGWSSRASTLGSEHPTWLRSENCSCFAAGGCKVLHRESFYMKAVNVLRLIREDSQMLATSKQLKGLLQRFCQRRRKGFASAERKQALPGMVRKRVDHDGSLRNRFACACACAAAQKNNKHIM